MFTIRCFGTGSNGNCYLVSKRGCHILIECGITFDNILSCLSNNYLTLNDIDYCLVSHTHKDHSSSFYKLSEHIPNKCYITTENTPNFNETIKGIQIYSIPVKHGKTLCNAFILKDNEDCLLFATDFNKCEYDLSGFKFTQIMIECNYYEKYINDTEKVKRQINSHMGLKGTILHLERMDLSKCKEIYLIHLSSSLSDEIIMRAMIRNKFKIKTYVCQERGGIK